MSKGGRATSGKTSSYGKDVANDETRGMEILDDVILVVDGKEIKTNTTLLAHNSSTFATMISDAKQKKDGDTEILYDARVDQRRTPRPVAFEPLRLDVPSQRYSDMKLLVQLIQNHDFKPDKLTGEKALQIVPLTKQFRMKKMKKRCEDAMLEAIRCLDNKQMDDSVQIRNVLNYLSAADEYKLHSIKELCRDILSRRYSASNRETLLKDKHISDKSKAEIFNLMCDRMTSDYDKNLTEMRREMERRCKEIEAKREESLKVIQSWKDDLGQEVDRIAKETKEAHDRLIDDFKQEEIIEKITEQVEMSIGIMNGYLDNLKADLDDVVRQLLDKDIEEDRIPPEDFWKKVSDAHEEAVNGLTKTPRLYGGHILNALKQCFNIEHLDTNVKESNRLQEHFESLSVELVETVKRMSEAEANYQAEVIQHENTKVELMRFQKRDHRLNTWIKWAKP